MHTPLKTFTKQQRLFDHFLIKVDTLRNRLKTAAKHHSLDITDEFEAALQAMIDGKEHLFITGKAGTGKSTLLTHFRQLTTKRIVVLAPTGVSALNVMGETIHAFFRFKTNITVDDAIFQARTLKNNAMLKAIDAIIIDEISMVRADLIDCIDNYLREALKTAAPFGGKQMIWIGDPFQLPPVVTRDEENYFREVYDSPYFFSAKACQNNNFSLRRIELQKIFRQSDEYFIHLLNGIRNRSISDADLRQLNTRFIGSNTHSPERAMHLCTTNAQASYLNQERLSRLPSPDILLDAKHSKKFDLNMAPTDRHLTLKIGAQVMFVNNNSTGLWVNGTLGEILDYDNLSKALIVRTQEGLDLTVSPHTWTVFRYKYDPETRELLQETQGSFTQFPLKLAWAITIHKSQGKTFDHVCIDLGRGAFAKGQTYVALSRCRTLEGITLKHRIRRRDLLVDPRVVTFMAQPSTSKVSMPLQPSFEDKSQLIQHAIDTESELRITYLDRSGKESQRRIFPKSMGRSPASHGQDMIVQAYCFERRALRVFKVAQIIDLT